MPTCVFSLGIKTENYPCLIQEVRTTFLLQQSPKLSSHKIEKIGEWCQGCQTHFQPEVD